MQQTDKQEKRDTQVPLFTVLRRRVAVAWSLLGFNLLMGEALYKITPFVLELPAWPLSGLDWATLTGWTAFMAYSEGYRGFQKQFSPRFAARSRWLLEHADWRQTLLAPLFCMGFFGTTRKRKAVAYGLTAGIVLLVILIRLLPQPWRGIVDAGVLLGLLWGLVSVLIFSWLALFRNRVTIDPEVV